MRAKTETLKFNEIGKCLPLRRLMRNFLVCFDLRLLPPVSSSCFLQFMCIFVECTTFLVVFFFKALVIQVVLLCRNTAELWSPIQLSFIPAAG